MKMSYRRFVLCIIRWTILLHIDSPDPKQRGYPWRRTYGVKIQPNINRTGATIITLFSGPMSQAMMYVFRGWCYDASASGRCNDLQAALERRMARIAEAAEAAR